MLWKVFNIESGKIIKAGFKSEDEAKEWLELKNELLQEDYDIEDMDSDEEEEWLERQEDGLFESDYENDDDLDDSPSDEAIYDQGVYVDSEIDQEGEFDAILDDEDL